MPLRRIFILIYAVLISSIEVDVSGEISGRLTVKEGSLRLVFYYYSTLGFSPKHSDLPEHHYE